MTEQSGHGVVQETGEASIEIDAVEVVIEIVCAGPAQHRLSRQVESDSFFVFRFGAAVDEVCCVVIEPGSWTVAGAGRRRMAGLEVSCFMLHLVPPVGCCRFISRSRRTILPGCGVSRRHRVVGTCSIGGLRSR